MASSIVALRVAGKFTRSFFLPQTVKSDAIKATYRDGILEIHVPKAEEAKPKQIAITVNESPQGLSALKREAL